MLRAYSPAYADLREYLDEIPIINTHEHNKGTPRPVKDVLAFLLGPFSYVKHDLQSAAFGEKKLWNAEHWDGSMSFEERYAIFERRFERARHTAYTRSMLKGLEACWGVNKVDRSSLLELQERMQGRDQAFYEEQMKRHRIEAQIADIEFSLFKRVMTGIDTDYAESCRFAFPLPSFHHLILRSHLGIIDGEWTNGEIQTLDDYVDAFGALLGQAVRFGVVSLKDQSAYLRTLDYGNPAKAQAEAAFDRLICDGRDPLPANEARALDDWLFQRFMRFAREHGLPVQLHTGHLAGNGGDVRGANAAHLTPLLELNSDVRFDLFHANWPYMGDMLFICKNYPNAYLNFCWAHAIDPLYCVEMMKRAVMTIPHTKIFAFGGDTSDIEFTIGHLLVLKEIVATALSELVDSGWLNGEDARGIALDWFYNNPKAMYGLGAVARS